MNNLNFDRLIDSLSDKPSNNGKQQSHLHPEEYAFMTTRDKDIIFGAGNIDEYVSGLILQNRFKLGKDCKQEHVKLVCSKKEWHSFINSKLSHYRLFQRRRDGGWVFDETELNYIDFYIIGDTTTLEIVGDEGFVTSIKTLVESEFNVIQSYIRWIHSSNGQYVELALNDSMLPVDSMYPFLNGESLHDYYDRFMKSSAGILLLIGPPGTGKTTFIRGLLEYAKTSAMVTYDPSILDKDRVFADFLEDEDVSMMVLEDSDAFLTSMSSGNTMMHRFLNVSNGLVTTKGKKMIFSTNLPSIKEIDPALIRKGRCFDVIKFDKLTSEEAAHIAEDMGLEFNDTQSSYVLADIFHEGTTKPIQQSFGFNN